MPAKSIELSRTYRGSIRACSGGLEDGGEYPVTVSNNGVDREPVEGTGAVFAYVPRPEVDGAEPRTLT